jgi:hypothetical protein
MTKHIQKGLRTLLGVALATTLAAAAAPVQSVAAADSGKGAVAARPAQAPPSNLFTNGDFSNGLTGWTQRTAPRINSHSVVNGHLRISPTGAVSQQIAVTPGIVHTLTAYLRINQQFELSNESFQGASIIINPANNPSQFIASSGAYTASQAPIGVWTPLYVIFTPTVNSIIVNAGIYGKVFFGDDISTQMSTDWDNFTLVSTGNLFADRPTSPPPAACTNTANLLTNGDFSEPITNGATGWRTLVYTDGLITQPVTVTNGAATFNTDGWIQQQVATTPGKTYYVSVRSQIDAVVTRPTTNTSFLLMSVVQPDFTQVATGIFRNEVGAVQREYFTFTAPLTVNAVLVNILTTGGLEIRGSVDDVVVSDCPIPSTLKPLVLGNIKTYLPLTGNGG